MGLVRLIWLLLKSFKPIGDIAARKYLRWAFNKYTIICECWLWHSTLFTLCLYFFIFFSLLYVLCVAGSGKSRFIELRIKNNYVSLRARHAVRTHKRAHKHSFCRLFSIIQYFGGTITPSSTHFMQFENFTWNILCECASIFRWAIEPAHPIAFLLNGCEAR